jgi:hypothetical protein
MIPESDEVGLIHGNPEQQGWDRCEDNNSDKESRPWVEGAWLNKYNAKYYLQYATPGTQWNIYSDAVATADTPLGPYELQKHNPFSFKPGGFINGAGHGSTFQDRYGNWWHISTMRISVRHNFERRLGLWPAGFDQDGVMFCNTRFGDYPMNVPDAKWDPWNDAFTGWMLLSYNKPVEASAEREGNPAAFAVNEDIRDCWVAPDRNQSHYLTVDLEDRCDVKAIQINIAEEDCQQYGREGGPLAINYRLETSDDKNSWHLFAACCDKDVPHDFVLAEKETKVRYIRLTIEKMPAKGLPAISGLRVFGLGSGDRPQTPKIETVERDPEDKCVALLKWSAVEGAIGYNVRWGVSKDKLYSDWLVYSNTELQLGCLNAKQGYLVAVEAFNENGLSELSEIVEVPT